MLHKNNNDINCRNISLFAASRNIAVGAFNPKKDPVVIKGEILYNYPPKGWIYTETRSVEV